MGKVNFIGSSSKLRRALFPLGFAAEAMIHIQETWRDFSIHHDVHLEERITAVFCDALIAAYTAAGRTWFIFPEMPITDPTFGTHLGRNDLRFYPPQHHGQSIFFTVECKRLHVRTASGFKHLVDEYVKEGLQRFVSGKYSSGLPCGGMVGYVMDNRIDDAFTHIQSEINARRTKLKMKKNAMLVPSSVLPSCRYSAETLHTRKDGELIVHHLLVETSHPKKAAKHPSHKKSPHDQNRLEIAAMS